MRLLPRPCMEADYKATRDYTIALRDFLDSSMTTKGPRARLQSCDNLRELLVVSITESMRISQAVDSPTLVAELYLKLQAKPSWRQ